MCVAVMELVLILLFHCFFLIHETWCGAYRFVASRKSGADFAAREVRHSKTHGGL